jgi:hypothetical protein
MLGFASRKVGSIGRAVFRWYHEPKWLYLAWNLSPSFQEREHIAIPDLRRSSLLWLGQSISIIPHQRNSLLILAQEFLNLPPEQLFDECIDQVLWQPIFALLLVSQ